MIRRRFWLESTLTAVTGVLTVLTLLWPQWLEALGFDPDGGDGSAEWLIVGVLLVATLALAVTARWEWRRTTVSRARPAG